MKQILQATVADVGRTEQSDHDPETGQWAKKNGGSNGKYDSAKDGYVKYSAYTSEKEDFIKKLTSEKSRRRLDGGTGYEWLKNHLKTANAFVLSSWDNCKKDINTIVQREVNEYEQNLAEIAGMVDGVEETINKWESGTPEQKDDIYKLLDKVKSEWETIQQELEEAKPIAVENEKQREKAKREKWAKINASGYANLEWSEDITPQGAFDELHKAADKYGVDFLLDTKTPFKIDKLGEKQQYKMKEALYGMKTMFDTYGTVFQKAQHKDMSLSMKADYYDRNGSNSSVLASINARHGNNNIELYMNSNLMGEYSGKSDAESIIDLGHQMGEVLSHELTHSMDFILGSAATNSSVEMPQGWGIANLIFNHVTKDIPDEKLNDTIVKEIREYATTNANEFLAECVAIAHSAETADKFNAKQGKEQNVFAQKGSLIKNTYRAFNIMCEHYTKSKEGEDWLLVAVKQMQKEIP